MSAGVGFIIGSVIISLTLIYLFGDKKKIPSFLNLTFCHKIISILKRLLKLILSRKKQVALGLVCIAVLVLIASQVMNYHRQQEDIKNQKIKQELREERERKEELRKQEIKAQQYEKNLKREKELEDIRLKRLDDQFNLLPRNVIDESSVKYGMLFEDVSFMTGGLKREPSLPNNTSYSNYVANSMRGYYLKPSSLLFKGSKLVGSYINCKNNSAGMTSKEARSKYTRVNVSCYSDVESLKIAFSSYAEYSKQLCNNNGANRAYKYSYKDRELIVVFVNNKPIEIIFMADDNKFNLTDTYDSCN